MRVTFLVVIGLLLLFISPVYAQQPNQQTQAAIDALNQVIPNIGDPDIWSFTFRAETTSDLGCPLVTGTELGRRVIAYRVVLTYGTTDYVYYVSEDTSIIVPCDPDIPDQPDVTPSLTPTATVCTLNATVPAANVRTGPSIDFDIVGTAPNSESYLVVGRTANNDWYQIQYSDQQQGWVGSSVSQVSGNCDSVPIIEDATPTVCTLSGNGAIVRQSPTTTALNLGTLRSGQTFEVLGTTPDRNWYYIQYLPQQGGWVGSGVATLSGPCTALPTLSVGATSTPTLNASGGIPPGMNCPVSFSNYLPPRIQRDDTTTTVAEGVFLSLRAQPNAQSAVVASLPPGTVIAQILDGPACANGVVWWQVQHANNIGWVPESNLGSNVYYLEPATVATNDRITANNAGQLATVGELDLNAQTLAFGAEQLALATENGVELYNYPALDALPDLSAMLAIPANIDRATALTYSPDGRFLAAGYQSGRIRLLDLSTGSVIALAGDHFNTVNDLAFNLEGLMVSVSDDTLKVWDLNSLNTITGVAPTIFEYSAESPLLNVAITPEGTPYVAVVTPTALQVFDAISQQSFYRYDFATETPDGQIEFAQIWWLEGNWGYFFLEGDTLRAVDLAEETVIDLYTADDLQTFAYTPFLSAEDIPVMALAGAELQLAPGDTSLAPQTFSFLAIDMAFSPDGAAFAFITEEQLQVWSQ